ncbi:hypothetical protein [Desulfosporosinus sp. BICA1-9]|uniref:hypothetical protein n=1 Tax=Desulfosporosinus sp. BICA1-9 TaxID=1531958 RepID=UPI00054C6C04|nr:hypothetical protein [Desulfosporosinus sp. BICA1-9]KJS81376.1 MAG: hypothetical protein JL57_26790 [Desulfosporosinus sp. BICA1-9]HBW34799.1 restriction endonuclease [Desulfosporosinus sp.]
MFSSDIPWEKYGVIVEIARRIQEVSPQFGKTVLQKLVYLLTTIYVVPTGYEHTLYTYGPFSAELASDVETVSAMEGVHITHGAKSGYEINPGNNADWVCSKSKEFINVNSDKIDCMIRDFGFFSAKELELRSTLIFLTKSEKLPREKLKHQLTDLKPYFTEEEVYSAIDELIGNGFIKLLVV